MSGPITTHALDTGRGRPADGLPVRLEIQDGEGWRTVVEATTNDDGRIPGFTDDLGLGAGIYRITFDTGTYFRAHELTGFYPYVPVVFELADPSGHYHVPLLISPWGYSTYRGS